MKSLWIRFWIIGLSMAGVITAVPAASAGQETYALWTGPHADELPYPTSDNTWLTLGKSKKQTSSTCIGKINTALCALETFLACRTRNDVKLCVLSQGEWFDPELHRRWPHDPYPRTGLIRYYISAVERYNEELAASIRSQEPSRQDHASDIAIDINWEMCGKTDKSGHLTDCCMPNSGSYFVLRRQVDGWHVVHYFHPVGHSNIHVDSRSKDYRLGKLIESSAPYCEKIKASITGPRLPGE